VDAIRPYRLIGGIIPLLDNPLLQPPPFYRIMIDLCLAGGGMVDEFYAQTPRPLAALCAEFRAI
jgi:hypothetical protein